MPSSHFLVHLDGLFVQIAHFLLPGLNFVKYRLDLVNWIADVLFAGNEIVEVGYDLAGVETVVLIKFVLSLNRLGSVEL